MARRLLGADNAATVLNTQDAEEEPVTQVRWLCGSAHLGAEPLTQTHSPETTQAGTGTSERRVHTSSVFDTNPTVACLFCPLIMSPIHSDLMTTGFSLYPVESGRSPGLRPCKHC